jgi:DNA-binding HxlR family transcriptional regulator
MFSYGQYCPIAKSAEILGDRWTLLIVREMTNGVRRFNEFHRGLPGISRSVLVERLRRLEDAGVLERRFDQPGKNAEYHLTEAGEDLKGVLGGMGHWAARWVLSDPTPRDSDPDLVMLFISRHIAVENLPDERVVVVFEIRAGRRVRRYWLVLNAGDISLCLKPPGFEADVVVRSEAASLQRVYMGRLDYAQALRSGAVEVEGPRTLVRAFPSWMKWSHFAETVRQSGRP